MTTIELKGLKGLKQLQNLTASTTELTEQTGVKIEHISIAMLIPGRYQPRKHFTEEELRDLADSIKKHGILQPLLVRKAGDKQYEIIAGERRYRAAHIAGLTDVPVIQKDIDDQVALAFALIENIQRENLNPIEEAEAYARFRDEFSMTHEEIAKTVAKSRVAVTNTLRLLSLSPQVRVMLSEKKLDMGHARALLGLSDNHQLEIAEQIVACGLTVRDVERAVTGKDKKSTTKEKRHASQHVEHWALKLANKYSLNVSVKINAHGKGKVIFHVDSEEGLKKLLGEG